MIELSRVPLSAAAREAISGDTALHAALTTGGDDYELLFTAPPETDSEIVSLSQSLGLPITEIGAIVAGEGVRLVDATGADIAVKIGGWRHF